MTDHGVRPSTIRGKTPLLERLECRRVAEELDDPDQELLIKTLDLAVVGQDEVEILLRVLEVLQGHPPEDPPLKGRPLVMREAAGRAQPEQADDLGDRVPGGDRVGFLGRWFRAGVRVAGDPLEFLGNLPGPEDVVDFAVQDRGPGHARVDRRHLVLGESGPAAGLDRLQRDYLVGPVAREDHPDGEGFLDLRERPEQVVDRHVRHRPGRSRGERQVPVGHLHDAAGGKDVDPVDHDRHAVLDLMHRHPRDPGEDGDLVEMGTFSAGADKSGQFQWWT